MSRTQSLDRAKIDHYLAVAAEREAIRLRKEKGRPAPWTDDPVLGSHKFCNVHRRDDRTSKTIAGILGAYSYPVRPALALGLRLINRDKTLSHWGGGCPWSELRRLRPLGLNTNAYRLNTPLGLNSHKGVDLLIGQAEARQTEMSLLLKEAREADVVSGIVRLTGVGPFIAYQAMLDLHDLGMTDHMQQDWAHIGPGGTRGLLRLAGRYVPVGWNANRYRTPARDLTTPFEQRDMLTELVSACPADWTWHTAQGWLCEYDKYERASRSLENKLVSGG